MSRVPLSKELFEQVAQGRFVSPWRLDGVDAPADYALLATGRDVVDRIAFVKTMMTFGLPPRPAYDLLNQLCDTLREPAGSRRGVAVRVPGVPDPAAFDAAAAAHGLRAERLPAAPDGTDTPAARPELTPA